MRKLKDVNRQLEQMQLRLEARQNDLNQAQLVAVAQQARAETLDAQLQLQRKTVAAKATPGRKAGTRRSAAARKTDTQS
ncbi:hypothetical protein D9M71_296450 [compost metagenome]